MASLAPQITRAQSRTLHGIGCVIVGMVFFAGQDVMMKSLLGSNPVWLLMFARTCVAVVVLVPLILLLGGPHRLTTLHWRLHLVRALLFSSGFSLFFAALPLMGLAEASTIFFSAPLIIALLAALFMRETLGPHRIGALAVGFAGVLIAMNPGGDSFSVVALLPLACAALYAASQVLARRIGDDESSLTVGLWTLAFAGPITLAMGWTLNLFFDFGPRFAHLRWTLPDTVGQDFPWLLVLGVLGMLGYTILSRAYQVAEASAVAPFDYSYLPIAATMAWLLWGEVPPTNTLTGMTLITASGLYIGWRELRTTRHTDQPAMVADTMMAPGNPYSPIEVGENNSD